MGSQAIRRATLIDRYVASRLKMARQEADLSMEAAGNSLGVTFQQIQKYEKGTNRVSASTLFNLAHLYGKPISWFLRGWRMLIKSGERRDGRQASDCNDRGGGD